MFKCCLTFEGDLELKKLGEKEYLLLKGNCLFYKNWSK